MVMMLFWVGVKESSHDILLSQPISLSLSWNTKLKNICSLKKIVPSISACKQVYVKSCVRTSTGGSGP